MSILISGFLSWRTIASNYKCVEGPQGVVHNNFNPAQSPEELEGMLVPKLLGALI